MFKKKPDGEVTVDCDGMKITGSYTLKRGKLVLKADGFEETTVNAEVLGGEKGTAADNLARLALVDMLRDTAEIPVLDCGISLQGSSSTIIAGGTTIVASGTTAFFC